MDSDIDNLLRAFDWHGESMVVLESAKRETISGTALMSNGSFKKDFWTKLLKEHNLESPGYHEAVRDAREASAVKKLANQEPKPKVKKKKS